AAVTRDADAGRAAARGVVLIDADARHVRARQILKAERAAIESQRFTLLDVLAEPCEAAAQAEEVTCADRPDPVDRAAAIDPRLRPLPLVRKRALHPIRAAELVAMIVVGGDEDPARVGKVVIDARQLGVVVVARLIDWIDEVVEALVRER